MEQIKKNFMTSFESNLVSEGCDICKEVESLFNDNNEFKIDKAYYYCLFIRYLRSEYDVDIKLYERCLEYILNFLDFNKCKENFDNYKDPIREKKARLIHDHLLK